MCFRLYGSAALLVALLLACAGGDSAPASSPAGTGTVFRDHFGDTTRLDGAPPTRIVSLNPTTTELLFAIGAGGRLVGRTHWDVYPDSARRVPDLGNGIQPNVEAVLAARPDLVVLYAADANRAAAAALRRAGVRTVSLRIDHIEQFFQATDVLSRLTGDTTRARVVADTVRATLERVRASTTGLPRPRVVWRAWDPPLFVIGGGSFLSELIRIAGGQNVFDSLPAPSPQVAFEDILRRDPDAILTGPAGAERVRRDTRWRRLRAVREDRVLVVDSALTLRPGVRLGEAAAHLARLLHPAQGR